MPSKVMDRRHFSSSFFSEEMRFPVERQVGFWKHDSLPDQTEGYNLLPGSKSVSSSPLEKLQPIGVNMRDQKAKLAMEESLMSRERPSSFSSSSSPWDSRSHVKMPTNSVSLFGSENINGTRYENGLFSSSFSDILDKKISVRLGSRGMIMGGPVVEPMNKCHLEEEPFELTQEIEAQTIGNLLPDDDDLLSGVLDEIAGMNLSSGNGTGDDLDDDIFFTGGGMELEGDELEGKGLVNGASAFVGEHPFGEHPSRTLFVRNINSNVEDSELRLLFEQYGDIRTLYTACKHRGFVMIAYYDIRSARNAMRSLQNKPLRRRKLDIHYSIPKDNPTDKDVNQGTLVVFNLDSNVTNDDLHQIFGVYGEIKEIRETPQKCNHKFIEYYDVRAAESALRALNRSDVAGKKIKLEPSRPGGSTRRLLGSEIDQDEINGFKHGSPSSSPSPCFGSIPIENGSLQSAMRVSGSPFMESAFPSLSSSISQTLSSPIGIGSMGPQNGTNNNTGPPQSDLSHSFGQMNFGLHNMPGSFHPHSLPEYHHNNGVGTNGLPYNNNNLTAMSAMGINVNSRNIEGLDSRHLHKLGGSGMNMNGHSSFDRSNEAFLGSGSCPLHGHQQIGWNNNNNATSFPHPSPPVLWSNSPASLLSNLPPAHSHHHPSPMPRAPSHLLDSLPLSHHHVGSAPSIWDRRHPYAPQDLSEPPQSFHPGSLGSMGFSGSPQLHHLEALASHGMFGQGSVDPTMPSPQQRGHMFHAARNPMVPSGSAFDAQGSDRGMRGRRTDSSAGQGDNKKQYELDVDKILRGDDLRTTLMIKNIPNKYTSKMLLAAIDENHRGTYDFIYLPIDFKNKCNVGYAFINMVNPQHIVPFYQTFNGKKWEKFNSEKVASLAYARIQGKSALIAHFQNSSLMNEDKRCRPILFHSDGPNAGDQEPFPMGSNIRSRSGRNRSIGNDEHSQDTLSGINITTNTSDNSSNGPFDPTSAPSNDSSE